MTALQNRLALHRFICREFGYEDLHAMLERLRDVPPGFTGSGESEYARALYLNPNLSAVTPDQLFAYDANIAAHSRKLRMNGEHGPGLEALSVPCPAFHRTLPEPLF